MRRPFRAAALAAISILGGLTMFGPAQHRHRSSGQTSANKRILGEIANYRSWEQVNDEPIFVPARVEILESGNRLNLINLQAAVSG